ncbi:MAG: hypothetical protein ABUL72_05295 [Armatimonadota bacterium]
MKGYEEAAKGWVAWKLPGHRCLHLKGADAKDWLQGQITQDVKKIIFETCLTSATGQIEAFAQVYGAVDGGVYIITAQPEVMANRVDRYVIMEDVTLEDTGREIWCQVSRVHPDFPDLDAIGDFTWWLKPERPRDSQTGIEYPVADEEAIECLMIEAGVPLLGVDTSSKTLPPELGAAFDARAVSYAKGCYVGQEVLMRMHSRGHTNKTWVCLRSDTVLTPGSPVKVGQENVGTIHRSTLSPRYGPLATATIRNEHATEGSTVSVDPVTASVHHWPLAFVTSQKAI